MYKRIGIVLSGYGGMLIVVALVIGSMGIRTATPTVVTGLAVGGLTVIWGLLALRGSLHRGFSILTIIPAGLVLLSQAVNGWFGERGFAGEPLVVGLVTLMFICTVAVLMMLGYAGVAEPAAKLRR